MDTNGGSCAGSRASCECTTDGDCVCEVTVELCQTTVLGQSLSTDCTLLGPMGSDGLLPLDDDPLLAPPRTPSVEVEDALSPSSSSSQRKQWAPPSRYEPPEDGGEPLSPGLAHDSSPDSVAWPETSLSPPLSPLSPEKQGPTPRLQSRTRNNILFSSLDGSPSRPFRFAFNTQPPAASHQPRRVKNLRRRGDEGQRAAWPAFGTNLRGSYSISESGGTSSSRKDQLKSIFAQISQMQMLEDEWHGSFVTAVEAMSELASRLGLPAFSITDGPEGLQELADWMASTIGCIMGSYEDEATSQASRGEGLRKDLARSQKEVKALKADAARRAEELEAAQAEAREAQAELQGLRLAATKARQERAAADGASRRRLEELQEALEREQSAANARVAQESHRSSQVAEMNVHLAETQRQLQEATGHVGSLSTHLLRTRELNLSLTGRMKAMVADLEATAQSAQAVMTSIRVGGG